MEFMLKLLREGFSSKLLVIFELFELPAKANPVTLVLRQKKKKKTPNYHDVVVI